jgi:hypothetical protein
VFAEIIAAAVGYEQSNSTHLRWERQFGDAAAQNQGICSQVPCRPSVNSEYSAFCSRQAGRVLKIAGLASGVCSGIADCRLAHDLLTCAKVHDAGQGWPIAACPDKGVLR